ncbi:MAG: selenocysteine-specific translation elongation factor [Acidobacteria bacterium]|nr:selenocysteine-specific translation elongation factor [Acidobacteriota bacterium]
MSLTLVKHVIVGTAGHIDHGKSALVLALTGTDPDRWEEEKRRGITIDLGFAHLDLAAASGRDALRLAFVDVPGHERFVRNMLAGVSGIDLVLLVIAADESIKPQTREHFDICRLLGIERGLTVLTKSDLVEPDVLELVRLETEEFLEGSFLEGAPIVLVSSKTGAGLDRLQEELGRLAATVPGKDASYYFRLPIDRAFLMKGFGTVVTGTLVSGSVGRDEEVEVFPQRKRLRVRGVQVHGRSAERATAGQRTALNLAGVEAGELERGMVLAAPGLFEPTDRVDARLTLLPAARPLKHGARVHFHQGTAEMIAEVRLLDRDELKPGEEAYAQLRLQRPALLLPGDRFIVRQFSPVITIGGGRVLSAQPARHRRRDPAVLAYLETLAAGDRDAILAARVERDPRGALSEQQLVAATGWRRQDLEASVAALERAGRLRRLSATPRGFGVVANPARLATLRQQALEAVAAFHQKEPLLEGISKEELKERVFGRAPEVLFEAVVSELVAAGELTVAGDIVKQAGRTVTLSREEAEAKQTIEQAFARSGLAVPAVKEVLAQAGVEARRAQKIVQILLREGVLVKVTEELLFHRQPLERLGELLRGYKRQKGERLSVPAFKELTGVTRKYAIPLLEYLDRKRLTRRVGDERVILH